MATRTGPPRSAEAANPVRARFDRFELDEANATLRRDGKAVALGPTPFALLCALVRQPSALLTKHALLDQVWGHQFVSDSVLKTAISDLRTALDDDARNPRLIETVSRRGYRFIAATSPLASMHSSPARAGRPAEASGFIGRGDALARLGNAWDLACGGTRAVVWIAGDPGIGKTTLIDHFVASLGDVACARGQCVEAYGAGEPHLPVLEALAELCRRDGTVPELLRAVAPAWLLQLPWLSTPAERDALRRDLAGVGPERMLREMGQVLDRYTERRPLLLVTEDLHWSDRSTILLLDYIARRRGSARLMWLASFRLAEVVAMEHPLNPVRRELRVHGLCDEILLDPFSEAEVADYLAQRSPSLAGDEPFVLGLHERTDGVPLFVASMLTDVMARAAQGKRGGTPREELAKVAIPEKLAGIIDHYVAKLDRDERQLLSAAAVCGVQFRIRTIAHALDRDAADVLAACDELARKRLWLAARGESESGGAEELYSFRHALFRQVLYDRLAPPGRVQLHRKVAAALELQRAEGFPVAAAELAMHFERGADWIKALRCYAEAARAALEQFSPPECLALTQRGLALIDQTPQTSERQGLEMILAGVRGAAAIQLLGVNAEAKSALQRSAELLAEVPHHPMARSVLHLCGFMLSLRAEYAEALGVAERAHALSSALGDPGLELTACAIQAQVHTLQGRPREAIHWIEQGLANAERLHAAPGEPFTMVDPRVPLFGLHALQLLHVGLVERGREKLRQAHAVAGKLAQPMPRLVAIWFDALFEVRLGNAERVATLADEMGRLVDEFALAHGRTARRWFRGWADARMGQPLEGYRLIREAYEDNTRLGMLTGGSETLGYAAEALLLHGDAEGAGAQLREALEIVETRGERIYSCRLHMLQAAITRARGDRAGAAASGRRALAEARTQEAPWLELFALVEICKHEGAMPDDRRALEQLVERLPEASETAPYQEARALLGKA